MSGAISNSSAAHNQSSNTKDPASAGFFFVLISHGKLLAIYWRASPVKKTRVNILSAVNADSIKIERTEIDGEKYAVIKNVLWMKDNIVLNDGLYSSSENAKGYGSMDGRVMPFGHPEVNGQYVAISSLDSADVAVALGKHYGGVHAQNVRQAGEDYFADVMINERVANAHADGVLLLNWVGKAEDYKVNGAAKPDPIQMSTGLMTARVNAKGESRGKS